MADKKISALTSASTPLAGTEVLPIVQSGSTVKVAVSDLTAGRDVSAKDLTTTGNTILGDASSDTLNVGSGDIIKDANGNVGIGQASPYNNAAFKTLAIGGSKVGFVGLYNASNVLQATIDTYNNTFRITTNGTTNPIVFYTGGSVTEAFRIDSNQNSTFSANNLVQGTAAKGVNFTANTPAAGMTSQLLNWYEEGNYTGTLTPTTSGTITVNTLANRVNYTRTGRVVYVSGFLEIGSVSSPVGTDVLLNLPFTISNLAKDSSRFGTAIFAKGDLRAVTGYNSGTSVYITIDASTLTTGDQFYISFNYIAA